MNPSEKQALDRWLTTDPRDQGAECGTCEGTGSIACSECGGTGHALVDEVDPPQPDPCPSCDWVGAHDPECRQARLGI